MSQAELYLRPPSEDEDGLGEEQYHVRLPVFEGPLDLLLHLIKKNEVDIYDIPIAEITRQYLEMLQLMRELNLNVAGEFIFMAATLIHIKSKLLLPPPHVDGTEEEPAEDPRAELVARLVEYRRYKEAAQLLYQNEILRAAMWLRPDSRLASLLLPDGDRQEELVEVGLFELISAFRSVLERARQRKDLTIERELVSIEEMIDLLLERIPPGGSLTLEELFAGAGSRSLMIAVFLALLEMVRVRVVRLYQQKLFGTIHVLRLAQTG